MLSNLHIFFFDKVIQIYMLILVPIKMQIKNCIIHIYCARFCESIIQMLPVNKNVLCIESSIKRLGIVSYNITLYVCWRFGEI